MAGGMKMYGKHRFPGRLFIVEGIDGSGKSTQLMLLQKWLESEGYVVYSSEWNSSALVHGARGSGANGFDTIVARQPFKISQNFQRGLDGLRI